MLGADPSAFGHRVSRRYQLACECAKLRAKLTVDKGSAAIGAHIFLVATGGSQPAATSVLLAAFQQQSATVANNDVVPEKDDIPTVLAAGVLAATFAAVIHETVGHGVGCLTEGGTITVLTSIWFRCRGAGSLTVAAGPAASLVAGLGCLFLLRRRKLNGGMLLVITLSAAFNLFWFSGQLIFHGVTDGDTWAVLARIRHWPGWWRPVSVAFGAGCYLATTLAILNNQRSMGQLSWGAILCSYTAGAFSAVLAGLLWAPMPIRSALESLIGDP